MGLNGKGSGKALLDGKHFLALLDLGLSLGDDLLGKLVVGGKARTGGDQLTDDHVLLQAHQVVLLALDGSLGEDLGGLLEGGGRQEGVGGQGGLGDTHEKLGALGVAQRLAVLPALACGVRPVFPGSNPGSPTLNN